MAMPFNYCLCFFLLSTCLPCVYCEDLYELLGLNRQATNVEIRKAFKKLALTMHPDKNRDDASAHEKFLKINRAYEILKDEDLRKKYDKYGEEGLKEGGPSGGGYQSWNFYNQQFGIYDDDPEIITLSRSDFDISVEGTSDVWFINFYSPHCSHCHDLAPTWREVARELVGVVRIGAVNCEDEWHLCRQKGIHSYPTLLLYPEREKYYGQKSKQDLVKYALDHVRSSVVELWSGNFKDMTLDPKNTLPWLINFCRSDSGECLEHSTLVKLSSMLDELVYVASMFCKTSDHICEEIGIEEGLYFFEGSKVARNQGLEITSYDAREIAYSVLAQLPDVTMLDEQGLENAMKEVKDNVAPAWLIHFVEGEFKDLELRKLPSLVESVKVGRVDCKLSSSMCDKLHISKFPVFLLFKSTGGHEIHYGRHTAHDIAAFAKDSYTTPVRTLSPQDFPAITLEPHPWFIDFFAPWCPPCMRLLPEFRKASKMVGGLVKFGTVDCTVHPGLCQNYNVHSYPTTILYNQTKPHHYHGNHHSAEIAEFVQDILKPSVKMLVPETFQLLVTLRSLEETWLVDFYAPWCGPCQQLAPEWRKLAKMLSDMKNVNVGQVDCQEHRGLCQSLNVQSYPSIRLYPGGRTDNAIYHVYNGWYRDAQSIRAWAFEFLPSKTHKLNDANFENKVFKSPKPWIVDFYAPWCGHCQVFAPEFERVALELRGRIRAGKVNCDENPKLCQRAGVHAYPSVRFYKTEPNENSQNYYGMDINSQDANYIIDHLSKMVPPLKEKFAGVKCSASNSDLVQWSDVIVIAVKPNVALKALTEIKLKVDVKRHLFISICAGITIKQLEDSLPDKTRIIRSMPNSPVAVGCGATVICKGRWANDDDPKIACRLFESVGLCLVLPEKDLNTVTAISGSGPAYVYMSIEAAGDGGSMMGMSRDVAQKLAAWTLLGAAKMYLETGQHPGALKDSVCSPGGTTLAGLRTLENGALRGLIMDTIERAHDKAAQLEEIARKGDILK